jgi:hypothetical protein
MTNYSYLKCIEKFEKYIILVVILQLYYNENIICSVFSKYSLIYEMYISER